MAVRWIMLGCVALAACTPESVDDGVPAVPERFATLHAAVDAARHYVYVDGDGPWAQLPGAGVHFGDHGLTIYGDGGPMGGLRLARWGRRDQAVVAAVAPVASGPQVRFERRELLEWYHARPEGLEQGFTVWERPAGDGEVTLTMEVWGLSTAWSDGHEVWLGDEQGLPQLRMSKLVVVDARGETVEAWMSAGCDALAECEVEVVIDDRGATYPLYVDPLLSTVRADRTSPDAVAGMGRAVALDGERVVVGAPGTPGLTDGIAVVLERNSGGTDTWGIEDTLLAKGLVDFGSSVGIDYPVVAVGAPGSNSVVVYEHDGSGANPWASTVTIPGGNAFGRAVDVLGDFVVVGEPGSVSVYQTDGMDFGEPFGAYGSGLQLSWPLVAIRSSEEVEVYHIGEPSSVVEFSAGDGAGVALSGERVAWGEPDVGAGVVHVETLERTGVGPHSYAVARSDTVLAPAAFPESSAFGTAVALSGDTLAVADQAFVHLFEWSGSAWSHVDSLAVDTAEATLALDARTVVVGQPEQGVGSVRLWSREADQWVPGAVVDPNESMGSSVAVSGDLAAVGAPDDLTVVGSLRLGRVSLFRNDGGWSPMHTIFGTDYLSRAGARVALDDGLLLFGEPGNLQAQLYVHANGTFEAVRTISSTEASFGSAVAIDDGLIAIGAPFANAGEGYVHLELLAAGTFGTAATGSYQGTVSGERVGVSLDLDGTRLALGASNAGGSVGEAAVGTVGVGTLGELELQDVTILEHLNQTGEFCGTDVAIDNDVVLVGCRGQGTKGPGRAQIFGASGGGAWAWERDLVSGDAGLDSFGSSVALSGDLAVVGAPDIDEVFVFARNRDGQDQWGERDELHLTGAAGTAYGRAVSLDERHLLVGQPDPYGGNGTAMFYALDAELPPVARPDTVITDEDTSLRIDVTANDFDGNGDAFTVVLASGAGAGALTLVGNDVDYEPAPDFSGVDSFDYYLQGVDGLDSDVVSVDIAVQPVNDAPTLDAPPSYVVLEDELATIDAVVGLLSFVSDIDSPSTSLQVESPGAYATDEGGVFDVAADGSFTYQPAADFTGFDGVDVSISDGDLLVQPDPVHVSLEVVDVSEAPVIFGAAYSLTGELLEVPAPGLLEGGYAPQGTRQWTVTPRSAVGTLSIDGSGALTYLRGATTLQTDTFDVTLSVDGLPSETVQVVVTAEALPGLPVGVPDTFAVVLGEVLDVEYGDPNAVVGVLRNDHGQPSAPITQAITSGPVPYGLELGNNGGLRYVTQSVGTVVFEYVAQSAAGASQPTTVTIEVLPSVTPAPIASDDSYATGGSELVVDAMAGVLANDAGIGSLAARMGTAPTRGRVVLQLDGSFVYEPPLGFTGTDSFTYRATDGSFVSNEATVTIDVTGPADTAEPDTAESADTGTPGSTACSLALLPDRDGDGFGDDSAEVVLACEVGEGLVEEGGDCDDRDAEVHPGAAEVADDGTDQDCDGSDVVLEASGACSTAGGSAGWWGALGVVVALRRRRRASGVGGER